MMNLPGLNGRGMRTGLLCGLLLFQAHCFDYEEILVFEPDFSGQVKIRYVVPLYPGKNRSLIRFLPVDKKAIEKKHDSMAMDYAVKYINIEGREEKFKRLAEVSYNIRFHNPRELRKILLGKTVVHFRANRTVIERSFPRAKPLAADAGSSEKRLHDLILKTMKNKFMSFRIMFPENFTVQSSEGTLINEGEHQLKLPLSVTMDKKSKFSWRTDIRVQTNSETLP